MVGEKKRGRKTKAVKFLSYKQFSLVAGDTADPFSINHHQISAKLVFDGVNHPVFQLVSMPRIAKSAGKSRHDPLLVQLDEDHAEARYGRISQPGKRVKKSKINDEEDNGEVHSFAKSHRLTIEALRRSF